MAGKRQATTDLNHENWDREEEPEERGTFRAASAEEIKNRVMKKARRKIVDTNSTVASSDDNPSTSTRNVFSGFSGFGNTPTTAATTGSHAFSFLSKIPSTNTNSTDKDKGTGTDVTDKSNSKGNNKDSSESTNANDGGQKSADYQSRLISLNRAFRDWVNVCVDNDPLCFLTPLLADYEKFLSNLNQKQPTVDKPSVKTPFAMSSGFSFGGASGSETKPVSMFGAPKETGDVKKPSLFSFTPGAQPFSFGTVQPLPAAKADAGQEEDEEHEPPKSEFKQVVEDDAIYSKKCKVFVKKDDNFGERGVGTLFLKPVQDSKKTQLLVRADTNLGNILVNIILTAGMPAKRMGKNNVLLVCIPTPDEKTSAPLLLRVKNEDEADDLLATITKYQKLNE